MNYKETLDILDVKLEEAINDLVLDNPYKSTRAEERIIAYCSARKYLQEKIRQEKFAEFQENPVQLQEAKDEQQN